MPFWVARNRQRKNAFAERAAAQQAETPAEVQTNEAARAELSAAAEAALRNTETQLSPQLEEFIAALPVTAAQSPEVEPEEPPAKRGRPRSAAVIERDAKVLAAVQAAEQVGVSRADLAELVGEVDHQVYTSLRRLQTDGKVESRQLPDIRTYRWYAL